MQATFHSRIMQRLAFLPLAFQFLNPRLIAPINQLHQSRLDCNGHHVSFQRLRRTYGSISVGGCNPLHRPYHERLRSLRLMQRLKTISRLVPETISVGMRESRTSQLDEIRNDDDAELASYFATAITLYVFVHIRIIAIKPSNGLSSLLSTFVALSFDSHFLTI